MTSRPLPAAEPVQPIPDEATTESMAGEEDPGAAMDTSLVADEARRAARAAARPSGAADRPAAPPHESSND